MRGGCIGGSRYGKRDKVGADGWDLVVITDGVGVRHQVSANVRAVLGWAPQALAGRCLLGLCHRHDVAGVRAAIASLSAGGEQTACRFRLPHTDGGGVPIASTMALDRHEVDA